MTEILLKMKSEPKPSGENADQIDKTKHPEHLLSMKDLTELKDIVINSGFNNNHHM